MWWQLADLSLLQDTRWNAYRAEYYLGIKLQIPFAAACLLCKQVVALSYPESTWDSCVAKYKDSPGFKGQFDKAKVLLQKIENLGLIKPFRDQSVQVHVNVGRRLESTSFFISCADFLDVVGVAASDLCPERVLEVTDEKGEKVSGVEFADEKRSKFKRLITYWEEFTCHQVGLPSSLSTSSSS